MYYSVSINTHNAKSVKILCLFSLKKGKLPSFFKNS